MPRSAVHNSDPSGNEVQNEGGGAHPGHCCDSSYTFSWLAAVLMAYVYWNYRWTCGFASVFVVGQGATQDKLRLAIFLSILMEYQRLFES